MAPGLDEGARVGGEANGGVPCGGDQWHCVSGYDQREKRDRVVAVDEGGGEMLIVLGVEHEGEEGEVVVGEGEAGGFGRDVEVQGESAAEEGVFREG